MPGQPQGTWSKKHTANLGLGRSGPEPAVVQWARYVIGSTRTQHVLGTGCCGLPVCCVCGEVLGLYRARGLTPQHS